VSDSYVLRAADVGCRLLVRELHVLEETIADHPHGFPARKVGRSERGQVSENRLVAVDDHAVAARFVEREGPVRLEWCERDAAAVDSRRAVATDHLVDRLGQRMLLLAVTIMRSMSLCRRSSRQTSSLRAAEPETTTAKTCRYNGCACRSAMNGCSRSDTAGAMPLNCCPFGRSRCCRCRRSGRSRAVELGQAAAADRGASREGPELVAVEVEAREGRTADDSQILDQDRVLVRAISESTNGSTVGAHEYVRGQVTLERFLPRVLASVRAEDRVDRPVAHHAVAGALRRVHPAGGGNHVLGHRIRIRRRLVGARESDVFATARYDATQRTTP